MRVGGRLLLARQDRKINQSEMADLLGVTPPTYSRLERNETSVELDQVVKFSKLLDIPIQEFLPETITLHNTNNQNGQGGMVFGNINNYYGDNFKAFKDEIELLKQKIKNLEKEATSRNEE